MKDERELALAPPGGPGQVTGDRNLPLLSHTVGALLDEAARLYPDNLALVVRHQNLRWTYRELQQRSDELANALLAEGLIPGDRVGIWAPNCAEWVLLQFATAKAGLILVNINPSYRSSELHPALNKVGCAALVMAQGFRSSDYVAAITGLAPELADCPAGKLVAERLPSLRLVVTLGEGRISGCKPFAELAGSGQTMPAVAVNASDPVNIQFTSGTTGRPKGATLSHSNIVNNGYFVGRRIGLGATDRVCIPVPLYHCFGMVMGNLACVAHGAAMVLPAEAFDPEATLSAVEEEGCTALYGVPTMFIAMLDCETFDRFDLTSLRTGIMAGSPCPQPVMERVIARMHMNSITIAYGMTETSPVSFQSDPGDPLERRVGTVGRIQPHLEARLVDAAGRTVAANAVGELCTRGYSVMLGYWDDPERTAEAIDAEGWMHTGDLGVIDTQGYCTIVGRIKDMIIRGGENIYPREIEEFLLHHPAIADVQIFGIPDERLGELVCAWIVKRPDHSLDELEVQDFCRANIAHFKIPRHVLFVESFPTTVSGKPQKFVMREKMIHILAPGA